MWTIVAAIVVAIDVVVILVVGETGDTPFTRSR